MILQVCDVILLAYRVKLADFSEKAMWVFVTSSLGTLELILVSLGMWGVLRQGIMI